MKAALIAALLTASAVAQKPDARLAQACGPEGARFKVTLDKMQHTMAPIESGKARIDFIHDAGTFLAHPPGYPTTILGLDGAWVGANHADSYFSITVTPGEHHVCATLQSAFVDQRVELAHFTAEAGKSYAFRTRLLVSRDVELLELTPIDSDQARFLVASYPLASSRAK